MGFSMGSKSSARTAVILGFKNYVPGGTLSEDHFRLQRILMIMPICHLGIQFVRIFSVSLTSCDNPSFYIQSFSIISEFVAGVK